MTPRTNSIWLARKLERGRRVLLFFAARSNSGWLIASLTVLVGVVAFVAWQRLLVDGAMLIAPLHAHLVMVAAIAVLTAAAAVARSRRLAKRDLATCWLATAPIDPRDMLAEVRWHVSAEVIPAGVAVGALIAGWQVGARVAREKPAHKRIRRERAQMSIAARFRALGRWLFARVREALNPRLHARIVAAILLALPIGILPSTVILILLLTATAIVGCSNLPTGCG